MALAQELMDPSGGPSGHYFLAMARLQLQREQFKDAEESIQEALQYSYQVIFPNRLTISDHLRCGPTGVCLPCVGNTDCVTYSLNTLASRRCVCKHAPS